MDAEPPDTPPLRALRNAFKRVYAELEPEQLEQDRAHAHRRRHRGRPGDHAPRDDHRPLDEMIGQSTSGLALVEQGLPL